MESENPSPWLHSLNHQSRGSIGRVRVGQVFHVRRYSIAVGIATILGAICRKVVFFEPSQKTTYARPLVFVRAHVDMWAYDPGSSVDIRRSLDAKVTTRIDAWRALRQSQVRRGHE